MVDKLHITELPKVETKAQLAEELNKAIPKAWLSAFCNKGIDIPTIQNTVTQIESKGGCSNVAEFVQKLASELNAMSDIREKSTNGKGTSRKSGKLTLTYTVTGDPKPFDKQDKLDKLNHMKADAADLGLPFAYQSQLDELQKAKQAWDVKYNGQLKLDKAKSSNVKEVMEKIGSRFDNAYDAIKKLVGLNPAFDTITTDIIDPLQTGTEANKEQAKKLSDSIALYRKMVEAAKAYESAIDNILNSCTVDKGNKVVDMHENPEQGTEA